MEDKDKWILEYDSIKVNGIKYWFRCVWSYDQKAANDDKPAMKLIFNIYKDGEGWIKWSDFKDSYLAEKFSDYIKNSINGQRAIYWDNKNGREF